MRIRDPPPFAWDETHDRPMLRLESEKAADGIELQAFGSDDEMANTMFAVLAQGEPVLTRHPEPLLVDFVGNIVEAGGFTMEIKDQSAYGVSLDEDQRHQMAKVEKELEEGLEDAPLGR